MQIPNQAMTVEQAIQKCTDKLNDPLAAKILVEKYLLYDQEHKIYLESSPEQMWDRLSMEAAKIETDIKKWTKDYRNLLDDWKFVPGGRILYGLGNPFSKITLKNCYVIGIQEDSIKGIFDAGYQMAETYKYGGGCGIDISTIRPKGYPIHNAARESTGSVSFMDFFSHITGMIGQKARMGALLICIDDHHPDIEDFISIKGGDDLNLIRFANISVKITDKFMKAVEKNEEYPLIWNGEINRTINARELWDKLIHYSWKRAEPGILFWDAIMREVPANQYKPLKCIATNPCLAGDARILTKEGYQTIKDLWKKGGCHEYNGLDNLEQYGELEIINKNGTAKATNIYRTSKNEDIYQIQLEDGTQINATQDHKFITEDGRRRKLKDLKKGDKLAMSTNTSFGTLHDPDFALISAWIIGDGSVMKKNKTLQAKIVIWHNDIKESKDKLLSSIKRITSKKINIKRKKFDSAEYDVIYSVEIGKRLSQEGITIENKHQVPKSIWISDEKTIASFLRGIFSADGSIQAYNEKASIRLSQSKPKFLQECQLLLKQLGIQSTFCKRRESREKLMSDGKGGKKLYKCQTNYELIISRRSYLLEFQEKINFIQESKRKKLKNWLEKYKGSNNSRTKKTIKIKEIIYLGKQETYCLTEPKTNTIIANGILTGNCGEVPSSHGDSCNLGSMNLSKYIINPYENNAKFDYDNFKNDVYTAIRFLDAIITLERSPLPFQQKINDAGRKLGLGVMGYADTLIKLKIKYGSEQSMQFTEQLFKEFMNNSYHASCNLAEEKGPFPLFNAKKHLRSPFIKRLPPELIKRIKKVGLRNVCLNSIAPTGSISNIARCSSGIEPIFMMKYKRKTNLGTAKKTEEYTVHHPTAKEWLSQNKGKELPDYFISAHQTDPLARIKLQGIMQKYVDLSISNTVNLPKTATEEEISKLLQMAWSEGCKGITIYRDESREGVLVKDDQNEIKRHHSPKRPITLPAKVHIIKPNGHAFTIFLGFLHGKIYEVFALDYDEAGLTEGQSGEITKVPKSNETPCSSYNYHKGALVVHNLNRYEHQEASMTTRLISTSLRHGVPIEFIVDQILKSKATMNSFARAIARALSAYIDKEEAKITMKCEKCKSKNLKIEGTCWTCNDCGQSKCG